MTTNEEKLLPDVIFLSEQFNGIIGFENFAGATKYIRAEIAEELAEYLRLSLRGNEDAEWFNDAYEALQKYEKMKGGIE